MSGSEVSHAPLAGIRVVDFGHHLAGPLAGMLLADQGATVIKVQRPDDARSREPVARMLNRGKHVTRLDLKCEEDLQIARRLVDSADVVIENFRPGVMKRLGLGPEEMAEENPRLIYLSLPGFSSTDPARSSLRAFEGVLGAATGLYTDISKKSLESSTVLSSAPSPRTRPTPPIPRPPRAAHSSPHAGHTTSHHPVAASTLSDRSRTKTDPHRPETNHSISSQKNRLPFGLDRQAAWSCREVQGNPGPYPIRAPSLRHRRCIGDCQD